MLGETACRGNSRQHAGGQGYRQMETENVRAGEIKTDRIEMGLSVCCALPNSLHQSPGGRTEAANCICYKP